MRTQELRGRRAAVAGVVLALGAAGAGLGLAAPADNPVAAPPTVPRAVCGPGDRPEAELDLQGQVTAATRQAGFAGTSCNLGLVGGLPGPGGTYVGAAYRHCAYYATQGNGVIVLDASDPAQPVQTAVLTTPAMQLPHESLKVNEARGLLAATRHESTALDVYDVRDCARPVLLSSTVLPGTRGHEGEWAPDGRTYYVTNRLHSTLTNFGFLPVDLTDPSSPVLLQRYDTPGLGRSHGLSLSDDGRRMYLTVPKGTIDGNAAGGTGVLVLDVSSVQDRVPGGEVRLLSNVRWQDGGESQVTIPVTVGGRPHLIVTDEWGTYSNDFGKQGCADAVRGSAAYGFPRVFDLADESRPTLVSQVKLQVQDPANCVFAIADAVHVFSYSSHYCSVDRRTDPTLLGCANFESGLRLFDIRDPRRPREVAYWNPPPRRGTSSPHARQGYTDTDWASSPPVFRPELGQVWVQFHDNGWQALQVRPGAWPLADAARAAR